MGNYTGAETSPGSLRTVVAASSTGTAFEWYDFFVYGALSTEIARNFFAGLDPTAGLIVSLAIFAAGFLFRPVGALVFGRLGDRFGRKGAFLATVIIMGGATFAIGLLPTSAQAGAIGAYLLIFLRILQGMAVGGEYGGAAIYVAEHATPDRRGEATSWIQSSASFGLLGAFMVILATRTWLGPEAFSAWGWRIPFMSSAILVAISIWMRMRLKESPEFERARDEGKLSQAPFAEVFLKWSNLKYVLIAFVALMGAQGAIWWCVFFYTEVFLRNYMKLDPNWVNFILIGATLVSIPLYVFFGWLSDRVGRKPVILFGIGLAAVAMMPAFQGIAHSANPAMFAARDRAPVTLYADPANCSVQFDLLGRAQYTTGCDITRNFLTRSGVAFSFEASEAGSPTLLRVGTLEVEALDGSGLSGAGLKTLSEQTAADIRGVLKEAGYPDAADASQVHWPILCLALFLLIVAATALYGPLAATMVELFPTHIRYTALSVPYHVGVGWVGGLMPMSAVAITAATGDIFAGLWYPVFFASVSFVCCLFLFPETRGRALDD
ncbi:MAG: MFS transporter [Hyphomonadaceae bacterium]